MNKGLENKERLAYEMLKAVDELLNLPASENFTTKALSESIARLEVLNEQAILLYGIDIAGIKELIAKYKKLNNLASVIDCLSRENNNTIEFTLCKN